MHNTQVLRRKQLKYQNISTNNRMQGVIEKRMGEVKRVKLQYERCSHHHNQDSDLEHNEIPGMEPYQFELELTDDESEGPEDAADANDLEHRRDNTDW